MIDELTSAEQRLFILLDSGLNRGQIADEFRCSVRTVRRHLNALWGKLGGEALASLAAPEPEPGPAPLRDLDPDADWRHRAACRPGSGHDPELFFPIGNTGAALLQIEEAKAVCRRCPVMEPCLQWAFDAGCDSGVFGGMSEDERRAMKRRHSRSRGRAVS